MTAHTLLSPTVHDQITSMPTRVLLTPVGSTPTALDGAWWPRSRDLAAELPALTAVLDALWGRITRLVVNPTHWPDTPRQVPVNGHVVKVGWFRTELDPHKLLLRSYRVGRWDLLVVPPETPPETAARLMTAAADPLRTNTASELMRQADRLRLAADADRAEAVWDYEGGPTAPLPAATSRIRPGTTRVPAATRAR